MLTFNYGSPYFWGKVVLPKLISGCRMVWDLICGTSWFYKSKTEKVTGGGKSAILPNWCCLLCITVLFTHPWFEPEKQTTGVKSLLSWDIYCDLNAEGRRRNCIFLLWIEQELISFKYEWRKWKRIKNYMSQYHLKGYENVSRYVSRNFNSHIHFVHLAT